MRQRSRILASAAILALAGALALSTAAFTGSPRTHAASRPFASLPGCGGRQSPGWALTLSPNGSPYSSELNAIAAVSLTDVWAVGQVDVTGTGAWRTLIEQFDGRIWRIVPSPSPGGYIDELFGVAAISAGDIWAVGVEVPTSSAPGQTLIEHWNGRGWQVVSGPSTGVSGSLIGITALSANDVWATGGFAPSTGGRQTLVEHWDGKQWSVVPSANTTAYRNALLAVSAVSSSDIWAVGDRGTQGAPIVFSTLGERYDGTNWTVVPTVDTSQPDDYLDGVAAISSTNVWAVGSAYDPASGASSILVEHWDGNAWSNANVPSPGQLDALYAVAVVPGTSQLWAVGNWAPTSTSATQPLVEQYDGSTWHADTTLPVLASTYGDVFYGVAAGGSGNVWAAGYWASASNQGTLIEHDAGPMSVRPCP